MSGRKINDETTKTWFLFREEVAKIFEVKDASSENDDSNTLQEAMGWVQGWRQFQNNSIVEPDWSRVGHHPENFHDQQCEIFKCRSLTKRKETLLRLVNEDPRWIFDSCGIKIFFQAAAERNYRFFKELSEALNKVKLEQHKNDLDHLKWFVYSKTPIWAVLSVEEEKRGDYLALKLRESFTEITKIIESNPSLKKLKQVDCLKSVKTFRDTCIKWYIKDLNKIGHRVPPAKKGRPKRKK